MKIFFLPSFLAHSSSNMASQFSNCITAVCAPLVNLLFRSIFPLFKNNWKFIKIFYKLGTSIRRKIPETLIRHSLLKPYLERILQYFLVPHWFANNKNISVKGKKIWKRKSNYDCTSLLCHPIYKSCGRRTKTENYCTARVIINV